MSSKIAVERICEFCEKKFLAKTTHTRYCSPRCNNLGYKKLKRDSKIHKSNEDTQQKELLSSPGLSLQNKDVLTVSDAAIYLSVSRRTIYTWLNEGKLKGKRISNRKVLFLKSHLISFLGDVEEYTAPVAREKIEVTHYTYKEIIQKYDVSLSWLYIIVERQAIRKTKRSGIIYLAKQDIDEYFKDYESDLQNIKEWYTTDELIEKYNLTRDTIYSRCKIYKIPKKREGRYVKISKKHFDDLFIINL